MPYVPQSSSGQQATIPPYSSLVLFWFTSSVLNTTRIHIFLLLSFFTLSTNNFLSPTPGRCLVLAGWRVVAQVDPSLHSAHGVLPTRWCLHSSSALSDLRFPAAPSRRRVSISFHSCGSLTGIFTAWPPVLFSRPPFPFYFPPILLFALFPALYDPGCFSAPAGLFLCNFFLSDTMN